MKRFIVQVVTFLGLLLLGFNLLNLFQGYFNETPAHYKLQYQEVIENKTQANGIILGTSHAAHAIRPSSLDTTGITFYNFSLDGSNPTFYLNWYQEFFTNRYPPPEYCVLSVDWFMFDSKWLWRSFEQDAEYFPFPLFLQKVFESNKGDSTSLITNRFPAIKYRSELKKSIRLKKGHKHYPVSGYDRGFIPFSIRYRQINFDLEESLETVQILEDQQKHFEELINLLRSKNVKLIFVMTPEYGISREQYNAMESLRILEKLATTHHIPFLNYNTTHRSAMNANITNFSDWGHMSPSGSAIFSTLLAKDVLDLW